MSGVTRCLIPVLSQTVPIQPIRRTKVQTKNKGGRPKQVSCDKLLRLVPPRKISLSSYAAAAAASPRETTSAMQQSFDAAHIFFLSTPRNLGIGSIVTDQPAVAFVEMRVTFDGTNV